MPDIDRLVDVMMAAAFFSIAILFAFSAFLLQVGVTDPDLAQKIAYVSMGVSGGLAMIAVGLILF